MITPRWTAAADGTPLVGRVRPRDSGAGSPAVGRCRIPICFEGSVVDLSTLDIVQEGAHDEPRRAMAMCDARLTAVQRPWRT